MSDGATLAYPKGAEWRGWDLHVHTPYSIDNQYTGGTADEVWPKFLDELENLPDHIRVLGINDYWHLKGYDRLREDKASGRLTNIDELFPVVEMRLGEFGGTSSGLSRANLHAIFSPALTSDAIRAQFLNALPAHFHIDPLAPFDDWSGVIDENSIEDLGQRIRAAMPEGQPDPPESDYRLGFNALVISLDDVKQIIDSSVLRGKVLLALGKTEWADIKWNDQTIASKRTLINSAHILFTAFEKPDQWANQRTKLANSNVRDSLLDCSDAHHWSDSSEKDRLGNCWTWIRADPTFAGLKQAILDFDSRVFVGLQPADLARQASEPESVLTEVAVRATTGSVPPFDYSVPLNPRLVAVIGNKGQGKSALLDCIARGANSSRSDFAFLNDERFLSSKNLRRAADFSITTDWLDGSTRTVSASSDYDRAALERVEYLPQSFIERVCSSDPNGAHLEAFEGELKSVLFTHIDEVERAGTDSLDALLELKTSESLAAIADQRQALSGLAAEYVALKGEMTSRSIHDLRGRLSAKTELLDSAEESLRAAVQALSAIDASKAADPNVVATEAQLSTLVMQLVAVDDETGTLTTLLVDLNQRMLDLVSSRANAESLSAELIHVGDDMNLYITGEEVENSGLVSVVIDDETINQGGRDLFERRQTTTARLGELQVQRADVEQQIATKQLELERLDQVRELSRREVAQQEVRVAAIRGNEGDTESIVGLKALIDRHESLPQLLAKCADALAAVATEILDAQKRRLQTVAELYLPATKFIADSEIATKAELEFTANLVVSNQWGSLAEMLDLRRASGLAAYLANLPRTEDLTEPVTLVLALRAALDRLGRDGTQADGAERDLAENLKSGTSPAEAIEAIFGLHWLELRFGLSGHGFSLQELSPGQRGLILLLFYLILDKRSVPLLLDQPEENLDNETIKDLLVPALRESSVRRQILLVTHNANLAIVGSADQIIRCRKDGDFFELDAGSAADPAVNDFSVDVLEGTWGAFQTRRDIYQAAVQRQ